MNRVIKILMERDDLSEEEATQRFNEVQEEIDSLLEEYGDYGLSDMEDVISSDLGLEPDYLDDFLF